MKNVANITLTEMQTAARKDNVVQMVEMLRQLGSITTGHDLSGNMPQVMWNRATENERLGFIVKWLASEQARQDGTS